MIVLSGAALVLPDRILSPGTLTIEDGRIADIRAEMATSGPSAAFAFHGHYIVPAFIDVHVHGVDGIDSHDGGSSVRAIAARLPRYGVTAFCPTTVACRPQRFEKFSTRSATRAKSRHRSRRACCPRTSKATSSTPNTTAPSRASACGALRAGQSGTDGRGRRGSRFFRRRHPCRNRACRARRRHRHAGAGTRRRARPDSHG